MFLLQWNLCYSQIDSFSTSLKGKIIRAIGKNSHSSAVCYAGLKGSELGSGLIYISENSGKNWKPLNNGKPIGVYVSDIQAIEKSSDPEKTLYAGTWKNGLYKSKDDGQTWQKDLNFPSSDVRSIKSGIQTPLLIYAATSYLGVVKSIDGGKTWKGNDAKTINSTFQFVWSIEIDKNDDNIIFAQTFNSGIWKSINQGETWKQVLDTNGEVCWDMKISKDSKNVWVVSSQRGDTLSSIYHSIDGGNTWEEMLDVPQIGISQINVVESDDENTIIIGSWKKGVHLLKDKNWIKSTLVDYDSISEILLMDNEILIGSWGNGTYNLKLE